MTAKELFIEARQLGLRLRPAGDKLAVIPSCRCPSDFATALRQHKRELLDLLDAQAAGLRPDEAPWLHVAKQILAGEFNGADRSMRESLVIGLRSIPHPLCREALSVITCGL